MIITTKFVGPTDRRGSRILVYVGDRKGTAVSWDYGLCTEDNHRSAARQGAEAVLTGYTVHIGRTLALPGRNNHGFAHTITLALL